MSKRRNNSGHMYRKLGATKRELAAALIEVNSLKKTEAALKLENSALRVSFDKAAENEIKRSRVIRELKEELFSSQSRCHDLADQLASSQADRLNDIDMAKCEAGEREKEAYLSGKEECREELREIKKRLSSILSDPPPPEQFQKEASRLAKLSLSGLTEPEREQKLKNRLYKCILGNARVCETKHPGESRGHPNKSCENCENCKNFGSHEEECHSCYHYLNEKCHTKPHSVCSECGQKCFGHKPEVVCAVCYLSLMKKNRLEEHVLED